MDNQEIILSIQDLSCYGRSSLAVTIPVVSATKVQVVPLPTAILSTHLGISGNIAVRELDGFITETLNHYKAIDISFDAIYSGYIDEASQIEGIKAFWRAYPDAIRFVDPVMGDSGKIYSRITKDIQDKMKELVAEADIITPNITEAFVLIDKEYPEDGTIDAQQAGKLLTTLAEIGPKHVVLTGVKDGNGRVVNYCFDRQKSQHYSASSKYFPCSYAGTGDIFASVYIGTLVKYKDYRHALTVATNFLEHTVKYTYNRKGKAELGIMIEPCLDWLYKENWHE